MMYICFLDEKPAPIVNYKAPMEDIVVYMAKMKLQISFSECLCKIIKWYVQKPSITF